jgi:hypothetical protein
MKNNLPMNNEVASQLPNSQINNIPVDDAGHSVKYKHPGSSLRTMIISWAVIIAIPIVFMITDIAIGGQQPEANISGTDAIWIIVLAIPLIAATLYCAFRNRPGKSGVYIAMIYILRIIQFFLVPLYIWISLFAGITILLLGNFLLAALVILLFGLLIIIFTKYRYWPEHKLD